jgi:hypothetical protein
VVDLLQILKLAKGLTGLVLASWGVYALQYVAGLASPYHEIALSLCMVAMFLGIIAAGVQVFRGIFNGDGR